MLRDGVFKQSGQIPPRAGETVGELKAVVGVDTIDCDTPAFEPGRHLPKEIGRGVGALFVIGGEETQAGKLINGCILEEYELGGSPFLFRR